MRNRKRKVIMKPKNNNEFHFFMKLKLQFDFAHVFESSSTDGITIVMLTISVLTVSEVFVLVLRTFYYYLNLLQWDRHGRYKLITKSFWSKQNINYIFVRFQLVFNSENLCVYPSFGRLGMTRT